MYQKLVKIKENVIFLEFCAIILIEGRENI